MLISLLVQLLFFQQRLHQNHLMRAFFIHTKHPAYQPTLPSTLGHEQTIIITFKSWVLYKFYFTRSYATFLPQFHHFLFHITPYILILHLINGWNNDCKFYYGLPFSLIICCIWVEPLTYHWWNCKSIVYAYPPCTQILCSILLTYWTFLLYVK